MQFIQDFVVGGISAAISETFVAPIERVKLIHQTQDVHQKIISGHTKKYQGIFKTVRRVIKEEGFKSLWRGNVPNIMRYFPAQAFSFAFKDYFKSYLCPYDPIKQPRKFLMGNILSGGIGGATSLLVVYPLDFARTRLGADLGKGKERQFKNLNSLFRSIIKSDGIIGLYRGFWPSIMGIMLYRGGYFGLYDTAKEKLKQYQHGYLINKVIIQCSGIIYSQSIFWHKQQLQWHVQQLIHLIQFVEGQ